MSLEVGTRQRQARIADLLNRALKCFDTPMCVDPCTSASLDLMAKDRIDDRFGDGSFSQLGSDAMAKAMEVRYGS